METKFRVPIIDNAVDRALAQGREQEAVSMVLVILEERFTLTEEIRARVAGCKSLKRLEDWARRAVSAVSIDDVFAGAL